MTFRGFFTVSKGKSSWGNSLKSRQSADTSIDAAGTREQESLSLRNFFSWQDQVYRDFMTDVLRSLNPRQEGTGVMLLEEMDEVAELIFVQTGEVAIGYTINKQRYLAAKWKGMLVVGAYNVTFYQRAYFFYKTTSPIQGYSIYKHAWL